MDSKSKNLDELINIIEESRELLAKASELSERLEHLRNHTSIGETVYFGSHQNYFFEPTIDNIESLISLKSQVEDLKLVPDLEREDYKNGDILMAINDLRLSRTEEYARMIDVNGRMYDRIYSGNFVVILDVVGSTYTLTSISNNNYGLIYATKTQLQNLFEHTNKKHNVGYHKILFNVNGIKDEYFEKLEYVYLYEKAPRFSMNEFYSFKSQGIGTGSKLFDLNHDEAFGTMGVAYFQEELKPNYQEISLFFSSKFAVMFTQDNDDKEVYKYNSKRSKFSKESGKDGKHYFPKDIFSTKGTKGRVLNLLENSTMFESAVKEESGV